LRLARPEGSRFLRELTFSPGEKLYGAPRFEADFCQFFEKLPENSCPAFQIPRPRSLLGLNGCLPIVFTRDREDDAERQAFTPRCRDAHVWTRERIIEEVKKMAASCGGSLSPCAFWRDSGLTRHHFYRLFPGGWTEVRHLAGIPPHASDPTRYHALTDEQLLQEFHRVTCELGAIPTLYRISAHAKFSADIFRKRFGSRAGLVPSA
jgi:hypothetical protein